MPPTSLLQHTLPSPSLPSTPSLLPKVTTERFVKFTEKENEGDSTNLISPTLTSLNYYHNFFSTVLHFISYTFFSYTKYSHLLTFRIMKPSHRVKYTAFLCEYLQDSGRNKGELNVIILALLVHLFISLCVYLSFL